MSDLTMALNALRDQITSAVNTAGISAKGAVFRGWPVSTELAKVIAQDKGSTQITLWPLKGQPTTRFSPDDSYALLSGPAPGLRAAISSNFTTLTLSGQAKAGDNIHAFFALPTWDANYGPSVGDETNDAIAQQLATTVNQIAVPGVTATATGPAVVLAGAWWAYANIGGTATAVLETARQERIVQVSVWAPDPGTRDAVANAIMSGVGGADQPRLTLADGTQMMCLYQNDRPDDRPESSYSTYRWDIFFEIEYSITRTLNLVQVEGFVVSRTLNGQPLPTERFGEP